MKNTPDNEIAAALAGIRNRLDTLASINTENILIPGGPQERYHQIVEEAYTALVLVSIAKWSLWRGLRRRSCY